MEPLRLDLFRPTGDTARNRPVVIFIHGGGAHDVRALKHNRDVAVGFAVRGFVSASIDMRSGTSGTETDGQHDIRGAVRWFRANAAALRIAPSRIVLFGSSAGGVGALDVNFAPEDAGDSGHPGYSSAVAAAIGVGSFDSQPYNIGPNENPILLFHAQNDRLVPIQSAEATCTQTRTVGNVCVMYEYKYGGHPPPFLDNNRPQMTNLSASFICRYVMPGVCHGIP
jgi:acetyl esterase/lipase